MDLRTLLRLGERLELRVDKLSYRSGVQDIPSAGELIASHPLDRRNLPVHLDPDQDVDVIFFRENGQFVFATKLLGRARVGNVAVVRLAVGKGEPVRFQRRSGYRLPLTRPVTMRPLNPSMNLQEEYHTFTTDLSESGLQVEFPSMVGIGTVFEVDFSIEMDAFEQIGLRAAVCRMMPPEERGKPWRLGMRFLDCPEDIRRLISRYIMMEQVQRRQLEAEE